MTGSRTSQIVVALVALVAPSGVATAVEADAVLERARRAYSASGAFHETLELQVTLPNGTTGQRLQDYGVGGDGGAFFRLSGGGSSLSIVARDGRAVALWSHIPGRYAETAYTGDFAGALEALEARQINLTAPPAVVAGQGGDASEFLDALRLGILAPLEPVAAREAEGADGSPLIEVELGAANGRAIAGFDTASGRLATIRVVLGEGDDQVRGEGSFSFSAGEPADELVLPDVSGMASVATLTALEASKYPIGEPAPEIAVAALDGDAVDLAALRGRVVVFDFWATWCVPCWSALEHTRELTAWAKASGLPVEVFAIDSLERAATIEEQRAKAREFLAAKGLDGLDVLVDHGDAAFAAFHNPGLPSLVIVDREGRLAEYHSGVLEDMTGTVRDRVLELVGSEE